jgi:acetyl esterase/lipase
VTETEIAAPQRDGWRQAVGRFAVGALRASLAVSPRPMALFLRREFASSGAERADRLRSGAPTGVEITVDEAYEPHPDSLLDVYVPREAAEAGRRLPVLVWVHGGAFIGGSKDEIDYYFRAIATRGFCVVAVRYSLAPESTYPTPVRQVMAALEHVQTHADRLHADTTRMSLAGDSAGSHISAQVAATVGDAAYAREVGVSPSISISQLRAVVLCCGIYDFVTAATDPSMKTFMQACGWAYSGTKHFLDDEYFISTTAVADRLTRSFPPTFLTVGNADPLRSQTEGLLRALRDHEVPVETLFYDPSHEPPLSHEYQFDLSLADGRAALERIVGFLDRHCGQRDTPRAPDA